jgi:hypothetical protein
VSGYIADKSSENVGVLHLDDVEREAESSVKELL